MTMGTSVTRKSTPIAASCRVAMALTFIAVCSSAFAQWTPWIDAFAPYPNGTGNPSPAEILGNPSTFSEFMWYCKNNAQCPTGTEPPYSAEFRLDFTLPDGPTPTATGRILADDYFALYVNGVLADSCTGFDFSSSSPCLGRTVHGAAAWLDDRLVGQPRAADVPLLVDFSLYLHTHGELNEIFIFACNGDAPTPRVPAGATPDQAPIGCPNPQPRLYQYVLLEAVIRGLNRNDEPYVVGVNSGNLGGDAWQAREFLDLNGDRVADCKDLAIVKASFGKKVGQAGFNSAADFNNDGVVDARDWAYITQIVPVSKC